MKNSNVIFRASVGLALCALTTGCIRSADQSQAKAVPPLNVAIVRAHRGEITRSITLPGNIAAYQQATLYAKVAGYLKTITVDKGDTVEKGDLLADIEVPEMIADLARLKADLNVAELDNKRVSEARKKAPDLVMPQTVDDAFGKREMARARLEQVQTLLGYAKITAPFSGVITRRWVDPGAFIPVATSASSAQNAAIVALADLSKMRVQAAVPESEARFIANDLPVQFTVAGLPDRQFKGTVTRYAHALDEATKTMLTESDVDNSDGALCPGMYATITLGVERKTGVLLVPGDALLVEKMRSSVFIVTDGKAKKIAVKTGFNDGASVEILEGLKPDEAVIRFCKQALNDGQPVIVIESK